MLLLILLANGGILCAMLFRKQTRKLWFWFWVVVVAAAAWFWAWIQWNTYPAPLIN